MEDGQDIIGKPVFKSHMAVVAVVHEYTKVPEDKVAAFRTNPSINHHTSVSCAAPCCVVISVCLTF